MRILDVSYLGPRVAYWSVLFAAAAADLLLHRTKKRRGYQLHRGVIAVIFAYLVQDVLLLSFSVLASKQSPDAGPTCQAYIFFTDLADALMIALLLTIAAGYCITRDSLGPYRIKTLVIPVVFFGSTLVVDYVVYDLQGTAICNVGDVAVAPESVPEQTFTPVEWGLLELCQLASLAALLLAWLFVFDTTNKERSALEGFREGIVGAEGGVPQVDAEAGTARLRGNAPSSAPVDGQGGAGHRVALPPEMGATQPSELQETYAQVTGEDADAPATVQQRLQQRTKLTLMTQFQWGVATYVVSTAAALLLPLFLYSRPDQQTTAVRAVLVLQNLVLWLFLGVLCFIFRPKEDNPYLILEDDEANASSMTDTAIGEVRHAPSRDVRQELGFFSSGELESPTKGKRRHSGTGGESGGESPASLGGNFTLGDEEEPPRAAPPRGRVGASGLKPRAPTRDI